MVKYLIKRLLRGLISVVIMVAIVMLLVFTLINRNDIFQQDGLYTKKQSNARVEYKYDRWEAYGYIDYFTYAEYLKDLLKAGEIDQDTYSEAVKIGYTPEDDTETVKVYVEKFNAYCKSKGYTVTRCNADFANSKTKKLKTGGEQKLFASKDIPVYTRIWNFFTSIVNIDNIHYTERKFGEEEKVEDKGITFTLFDPVYNTDEQGNLTKKVFSPAIIGNGTRYKYLLYFDGSFPFVHQNLIRIKLGLSYSINTGVDVWDTMTQSQGSNLKGNITYPKGKTEYVYALSDLHSAEYGRYVDGKPSEFNRQRFNDKYTKTDTLKQGFSKMGYSFIIGIIASAMAYLLGIPIGLWMARKKDKLVDKIGTLYIIFIIAVPSLAYIFMFRAIGMAFGLPYIFDVDANNPLMYVLPVVSLALPSIGGLMRWVRRYVIDQENSDYVKFARSGGLSEGEIFRGHILKNAVIPIVHGIPGTILGALVGALITERVYSVPGAGGMIVKAITYYDNAAIVGITLFYAMLSIISLILGDILMALMDPRISFSEKGR